jgi:tRNA pseudouridine13 synthase
MRHLSSDIPGIGGVIKERCEDFIVEEQPLYEPCGQGEHLYLYIEKKDRTTTGLARRLAEIFHVRNGDVGFAGLKDRMAVTRQQFSIYLPKAENEAKYIDRINFTGVNLLGAQRHGNKLRRGHLAGNRFEINIRQVQPTAVLTVKRVLERLTAAGMPNYIGPQRFGYRGDNGSIGRCLLLGQWQAALDLMLGNPRPIDSEPSRVARAAYDRGDYAEALHTLSRRMHIERRVLDLLRQGKSSEQAVAGIDHEQRRFLISGLQSEMFNSILDQRVDAGLFDRLVDGDLAWKHDSRAVFAVDEATAELENAADGRVALKQVSPSGPMWGPGMTRAAGQVAQWEQEALAERGLSEQDLPGNRIVSVQGARRSMRQFLDDPQISGGVDEHGPYVRVAFGLGRGEFATTVLDEIMKTDACTTADQSN